MFFPHLFWTVFLNTCLNFYTYFRIHLTRYKFLKDLNIQNSLGRTPRGSLRKRPFYVLSHHPVHIYSICVSISHCVLLVTLFYFLLPDFGKLTERPISYLCILSYWHITAYQKNVGWMNQWMNNQQLVMHF